MQYDEENCNGSCRHSSGAARDSLQFNAGKFTHARFSIAHRPASHTLNDLFFAGDKGVWRGTWHATQRGDWEGITASGRKATGTVIIIGRFAGGKLAEDWVEYDRFNLFRQLGAI